MDWKCLVRDDVPSDIWIGVGILVVGFVAVGYIAICQAGEINALHDKVYNLTTQKNEMMVEKNIMRNTISKMDFLDIAKNVSNSYNYSKEEGFTCVDFSLALSKELKDAGYEAKVVKGMVGDYCKVGDFEGARTFSYSLDDVKSCFNGHAWVEVVVGIDAVTGEVIGGYRNEIV